MLRWSFILCLCAIAVATAMLCWLAAWYPGSVVAGSMADTDLVRAGLSESEARHDIAYSDFIALVERGDIRDATIDGAFITGDLADGGMLQTYAPDDPRLIDRLAAHGVTIRAAPDGGHFSLSLRDVVETLLPTLALIGFSIWTMRVQSGRRPQPGFRRSRARLAAGSAHRLTFADVAGIDEACEELGEIVEFLKHPQRFRQLGGKLPKGCLLAGPPGTGKTLLARAIAGEAGVPFFAVSGSDFVEMYAGVGASRVRDLFEQGRKNAPCILFIDEIDAVGRRRAHAAGGNEEREQTLNQLLVEMDGAASTEGVIVLAATNRPDVLDPALLRPGRFDRQVAVPTPDRAGRERILAVHLRYVRTAADIDLLTVARGTPGFSGADLANLVNEAALRAARAGETCVTMRDIEEAKRKIILGPERRSLAVAEDERRRTAYHESGHALAAWHVPGNDPLQSVTIIPRGTMRGRTLTLADHDHHGLSRQEIEARLALMLAGRVAEDLVYGPGGVSTGAADDVAEATALARRMVTEFGLGRTLGPICYAAPGAISEATAAAIDGEIRRTIRDAETTARRVLVLHLDALHRLAGKLLEQETLSGEEVAPLLATPPPHGSGRAPPAA